MLPLVFLIFLRLHYNPTIFPPAFLTCCSLFLHSLSQKEQQSMHVCLFFNERKPLRLENTRVEWQNAVTHASICHISVMISVYVWVKANCVLDSSGDVFTWRRLSSDPKEKKISSGGSHASHSKLWYVQYVIWKHLHSMENTFFMLLQYPFLQLRVMNNTHREGNLPLLCL